MSVLTAPKLPRGRLGCGVTYVSGLRIYRPNRMCNAHSKPNCGLKSKGTKATIATEEVQVRQTFVRIIYREALPIEYSYLL